MDQEHKLEVEKVISGQKVPEDCKCYRPGFGVTCRAKDVGLESHLECLEEHPFECTFSVGFGRFFFCRCPLRIYIAKKLGSNL
jgi:hypothetical protein